MKHFFTLMLAMVMSTVTAMATDYTDNLIVTVDGGNPTTVNDVKITVTQQENEKYSFSLKNFSFAGTKVGDIELNDIEGQEKDGIITLNVPETKIRIKNPALGIGTTINFLGGIKFSMTAKISNVTNKMYADMTMKAMAQNIKAIYGDEKNITTGIKAPQATTKANNATSIFTLAGQQISSMTSGNVYIVKTTDGKTKKVIKK
uniref:calycin-like domain-containing protein n=1 Tax=Segatella hominis TaxID=2518605 RepID=UPI004026C780